MLLIIPKTYKNNILKTLEQRDEKEIIVALILDGIYSCCFPSKTIIIMFVKVQNITFSIYDIGKL